MGLGKRIWRLWTLRPYVLACAAFALLVAVSSVASISLSPPGLRARSLEMATATTHVVVDTPRSSVLDLRQNTYSFEALTQRAVLLGNVMANGPVRADIARRARVPADVLMIAAPLTPKVPRAPAGAENQKKAGDILKSTNQYRISIEANPTVPVLDIYAQAPTVNQASELANASVDGLRAYLGTLATDQQIPSRDQIRLLQLGRARGAVINRSVDWQTAFVAFVLTFALACATVIYLSRVLRGLRLAALDDRQPAA